MGAAHSLLEDILQLAWKKVLDGWSLCPALRDTELAKASASPLRDAHACPFF